MPERGTRDGCFPVDYEPVGHLYWAGTETATEHAGYIEGAVASSERVADEVARAFGC